MLERFFKWLLEDLAYIHEATFLITKYPGNHRMTLTYFRLDIDTATMLLYYPLHCRQPQTHTEILGAEHWLENIW